MAITALAALATTTVSYVAGTMLFTKFIATFAFNFAMGLALKALSPRPSISGANRGYQVNTAGSALDHQIIYGKVRVGGAIVYDEATGDTNQYLHRIVAVSGHEINSFDRIYINDEYIDVADLDADGNVPLVYSSDGSTTSARYDGKLRINLHLGTPDQAADSDLVSESDGLWTSDHRLRGIAYMYMRMEFDADVYPDGIPTFTAEVKGKKVYDPNSETTAWSDNPALCLRDYLSSTGYGLGEVAANIDDTLVNAAVSVCNQTNTQAGTTRYTCNGAFTTNVTPYEAIDNLLSSMGGTLWYAQGKWRMKPAYWTTPVLDLNEDDLRSGINVSTRHSRRDNFNSVRGTFRGAESNWQTTDYPEVTSPASVIADNNQKSIADVDLPFTDNSIEARRIARIALDSNRQQLTVTAAFGLTAMQVQVGDNIRVTNERFGWVNKEFQVLSWGFGLTDGLDLQVNLTLRETAESVYDEVDDGAAYERDNTNLPDPFGGLAVSNLIASGGGRIQGDGTFINSAILSWTAATSSFVSFYEIQWKALVDSSYSSTTTPETTIEISPLVDGVEYVFRVRAVSINGVKGAFTTVNFTGGGDTTAPGLPTSITATGGFRYITINWTNPADADLKHVEVWENDTNTTSGASLVGISGGSEFIRSNLNVDQTKYYFLKSVDYSDNKSAFTSGVSATTTFIDDPDFENGVYSLFTEQNLYAIEDVTSLPPSGSFEGQKVFNRTDGKLYQWTGSAWEQVVGGAESFGDLQGSIAQSQIPNGVIDTAQIADDAIIAGKISANAVGANAIAANSIYAAAIQGGVITGDKISANTITGGLIAASGIITNSAQINDAIITNAKISNIAADKITAGTLDVARLPGIGVAGTTAVSSSTNQTLTVNVSFSGVTVGSSMLCVIHGTFQNSRENSSCALTPTGSNVTLAHTQSIGGFTENTAFYSNTCTATATSSSGNMGFNVTLGNGGTLNYTIACSLITFKA